MAFRNNAEFKYSIRGINRIIDEKNNQFIRLAEIAWAGADEEVDPSKIKYDLRRYFTLDIRKYTTDADGNERMLKGCSFLTEDGPHELTHALVEEGFGNTEKILTAIKQRSDFPDAVKSCYGEKAADATDDVTVDFEIGDSVLELDIREINI